MTIAQTSWIVTSAASLTMIYMSFFGFATNDAVESNFNLLMVGLGTAGCSSLIARKAVTN